TTLESMGLAAGDFNRDGKLDLVQVGLTYDGQVSSGHVNVLLGQGDGTFATGPSYSAGSYAARVITADFNQDAKLDILFQSNNGFQLALMLGNGDGTFQSPYGYLAGYSSIGLAAGDLNADGSPEAVFGEWVFGATGVLLNQRGAKVVLA